MSKKSRWVVRLGGAEWSHYTYARPHGDSLRLIGSVQRGLQVGALAVTAEGIYVQLVGDHMVSINRSQIVVAIAAATKASESRMDGAYFFVPPLGPTPVVIVKKRRVLEFSGG